MAGTSYFDYLDKDSKYKDLESSLGRIEQVLGITPSRPSTAVEGTRQGQRAGATNPLATVPGKTPATGSAAQKGKGSGLNAMLRRLRQLGVGATEQIQKSEFDIKRDADEYAQYLAGQVRRGEKSPGEASDLFSDYSISYQIPGGFKTSEQLAGLSQGIAPTGATDRYDPFIGLAAKNLGINFSAEQAKGVKEAARALGKTTPEAFSQFLGATMMSSPEYIRKTPLAFAANLPYGGEYGVGYQTPKGTFTGTYRFKPPTTVNWS